MAQKNIEKYHKELFDHFGYNFGFVADLLEKYMEDSTSVSEYWKNYFEDLVSNGEEKPDKEKTAKKEKVKSAETKRQSTAKSFEVSEDDELELITGVGAKIIENMDNSLTIPIATSLRNISVKLLEENRRIINQHLKIRTGGKVSYTHLVAYAIIQALKSYPKINDSFAVVEGDPYHVKKPYINFGIAVDMERKDGSRTLIVPNIKKAGKKNFSEFYEAFNDLINRTKKGKIEPADFQNTTITLTNPGGIGTVSSNPRLMTGQGAIIAVGAIDYPAEFKAMHQNALASIGIGKVMSITSTYDHRIIQGAESGEFLGVIDDLLLGKEDFYERIFEDLQIPQRPVDWGVDSTSEYYGDLQNKEEIEKQARILQLINMFRVRGHLIANLNPLSSAAAYHEELDPAYYNFSIWDYDRYFITGTLAGSETATLRQILEIMHKTYCEKIGVEYMHIQNPDEKEWLQRKMEPVRNTPDFNSEIKKRIMEKLIQAEAFEHFLHTKFIGHKRFSLEGSETLIPLLDHLFGLAAEDGVEEAMLGMAHRGRLNVLSNLIGKSYEDIFSEFEEHFDPDSTQGTGDVKYHLGATGECTTFRNKSIQISVASNPSHLEWVNPIVEGKVRAKQTRKNDSERNKIIPILIHGDAAFAGQGVVAETLNLSQLSGYRTGGTVHIIINNQIGFTTAPEDARSSPYATDVAKMVQAPIFHVNGDDPEASLFISQIAFEYRQQFKKDVVIDLFGYRRHGHNEGDDPAYTQPILYKKIKEHSSVKELYQKELIKGKIYSEKEIEKLDKEIYDELEKALKKSKKQTVKFNPDKLLAVTEEEYETAEKREETKVSFKTLSKIVNGLTDFPENFTVNAKLKKHILKRRELLRGDAYIDWAFGEALAFGSLLLENIPVRLSGQDSVRGTFSQRHLVLTDTNTGAEITPHNSFSEEQAKLEALDSLLSEAAVLGFEYGFSAADPLTLVMWEAQFGDFANSAQVIIDNFIVSSQKKWQLPNSIVMLLPHGQEGQGPEHSSARLERFLQLCADDNMFVCNPTTPAQYFHLLRRHIWHREEKPMAVMTPKSLLRLPAARSAVEEFTEGKFHKVIDDGIEKDKSKVKKIVLTSGKIYYDLIKEFDEEKNNEIAIVRMEQYYPYPKEELIKIFNSYSNAEKISWVQEEPKNMGAWSFMLPRLLEDKPGNFELEYIGRPESPSPAAGSSKMFKQTQEKLIEQALNI